MDNPDLSNIFQKLNINKDGISPDAINNLMNALKNSNTDSSENDSSSNNSGASNMDFETILKMKSIMDKMNSNDDPRQNLLLSLKPYLKGHRLEKIDQYIQLLKISKAMDSFPFLGGENKSGSTK